MHSRKIMTAIAVAVMLVVAVVGKIQDFGTAAAPPAVSDAASPVSSDAPPRIRVANIVSLEE